MEETIVEVLEISMKCRTSQDKVKTILLTDFISPQRVTLTKETEEEKKKDSNYVKTKKFILTIEEDEYE